MKVLNGAIAHFGLEEALLEPHVFNPLGQNPLPSAHNATGPPNLKSVLDGGSIDSKMNWQSSKNKPAGDDAQARGALSRVAACCLVKEI